MRNNSIELLELSAGEFVQCSGSKLKLPDQAGKKRRLTSSCCKSDEQE